MIKKILVAAFFISALNFTVSAQKGGDYTNAIGLGVDFGSDFSTLVGISGKHFFSEHNAGQVELQFGTGITALGIEYLYHATIQNAGGLKWYLGLGPQIGFGGGSTVLLFRPMVGLDYKINEVPLSFSFDWRPAFQATQGTAFYAARFGLGFRYSF